MKRILLLVIVIGILLLSACGAPATAPKAEAPATAPTEKQTYTLSISISPSGEGSVSPSGGQYESGTEVPLTATAASGYTFDYWDGAASGPSSTTTITMDSNKSITAHFTVVDIAPPIISRVEVSNITETGSTITWTTDESSNSHIEYGKTASYGSTTPWDASLVTSHSITLTGLNPNTTYHFRVRSKDEAGNEAISGDYIFTTSKPATKVSGIISGNTIWTEESSPYVITSTIQIPAGVTLTIEPGVTITTSRRGAMFLLHGTISARGTPSNKIIFDGGGVSQSFFITSGGAGSADFDYCIIRNGQDFWTGVGHFNLTHSELTNLTKTLYSGSPTEDMYIEYNRFTNTRGLTNINPHFGSKATTYIRYNLFQGTTATVLYVWENHDRGMIVVKYNSFIDIDETIMGLRSESANFDATENYWGTLDTDIIDQKILDKNDSIVIKSYITYLPILTEPHPSTPTP